MLCSSTDARLRWDRARLKIRRAGQVRQASTTENHNSNRCWHQSRLRCLDIVSTTTCIGTLLSARWRMAGIGNCRGTMQISMTSRSHSSKSFPRRQGTEAYHEPCPSCQDPWHMSRMQSRMAGGRIWMSTFARSYPCPHTSQGVDLCVNYLHQERATLKLTLMPWVRTIGFLEYPNIRH